MARAGVSRRALLGGSALTAALLCAPHVAAQAKPRVVIVGGGAGGANAARAVLRDGRVDVTLVEPEPLYVAVFHSNLWLGGFIDFAALEFGYQGLARAGMRVVPQRADAIDRERREVRLADGGRLPYDRLILSPGIDLDYDSVPGWSRAAETAMPHAWKGGAQLRILKERLDSVPDGGLIVIIAPPNPFRCPPAPYERASMMAHRLKTTGRGGARIIIVDPKPKFSMQGLFQEGWEGHYPGMVEWMAPDISDGLISVEPATGTVVTGFETYREAALVNVIPAQKAGAIARGAGLADVSGWCPVEAASMASALDPAVFVIGDAAIGGEIPKSAFAAGSQADVAARALLAGLFGEAAPSTGYASTCWSLIAADDAVKVSGLYRPVDGRIREVEGTVSGAGEPPALRRRQQEENADWYRAMVAGMFG